MHHNYSVEHTHTHYLTSQQMTSNNTHDISGKEFAVGKVEGQVRNYIREPMVNPPFTGGNHFQSPTSFTRGGGGGVYQSTTYGNTPPIINHQSPYPSPGPSYPRYHQTPPPPPFNNHVTYGAPVFSGSLPGRDCFTRKQL